MGYRQVMEAIALNQLTRPVQVPDYRLMAGTAEELSSQPIVAYIDFMPKSDYNMLPDPNLSYEDVQDKLASGQLTVDDFFANTYQLGSPLEKG